MTFAVKKQISHALNI